MLTGAAARPAVSVLMAVHNGASTVQAAVDGILAQTFTDFELVILDDASTDDTPDILQTAAARDARVRLLYSEQNQGLTRSLNRLLRRRRGTPSPGRTPTMCRYPDGWHGRWRRSMRSPTPSSSRPITP